MKPLTVDCARIRPLLPGFFDGALPPAEAREVSQHLSECSGCTESLASLKGALAALGTLSAEDLNRLRSELPELDGSSGLDPRPFGRVLLAAILVVALVFGVLAWRTARRPAAPPPAKPAGTATSAAGSRQAEPAITIGFVVGIEEDPVLLAELEARLGTSLRGSRQVAEQEVSGDGESAELELRPASSDEDPAEAEPGEPEQALADRGRPGPDHPRPAEPDPAPGAPANKDAPQPKDKNKNKNKTPPAADLPPPIAGFLGRVRLPNSGFAYQEVALYPLVDPSDRGRIASRARIPRRLQIREQKLPNPSLLSIRPPQGQRAEQLLVGQLIDSRNGLRYLPGSLTVRGWAEVGVGNLSFNPARPQRSPLLKGPLLLTSLARAKVLAGDARGAALAEFLRKLADPSRTEFRRLQEESGRLESEARALEVRLRSRLRPQRGIVGIAYAINGTPRGVDVFADSGTFSDALPAILRSLLLEARLEDDTLDEDLFGDVRSVNLVPNATAGRAKLFQLLGLMQKAKGGNPAAGAAVAQRYQAQGKTGEVASVFLAPGASFEHGVALIGE